MSTRTRSAELFAESLRRFPGGVNSPVRAFRSVGGTPPIVIRGAGSRVTDADGRVFIDYIGGWGALVLGHAHPAVTQAIAEAAGQGTTFGVPSQRELDLARLIQDAVPSVELLRFVNSGTEAAMSALRLARGFTGRDVIVKFAGCYHGHADALLAQAGSGLATFALPNSAGVPAAAVAGTIVLPYNDVRAAEAVFAAHGEAIAAVIIEPVAANMGLVRPEPGFLQALRDLTTRHQTLLIFDEVITGFRVRRGGAQAACGVTPDLTCLGKIIGGGLPVGAYGGRREIMERLAPLGPVYQAGTLSGNPVTMAAGAATLAQLTPPVYDALDARAARLAHGLADAAAHAGVPVAVVRVASMLTVFFAAAPPRDYAAASRADVARFARFFQAMLARDVLLPPSQFETWFVGAAHSDEDIADTIAAAHAAFAEI